ncbi:MAG TPA: hemolysin III family protein [Beijerinckiaceae bacterium]|nr:hemolysin III family protein [Beijerinckiaceae bacterium]
MTLPADHPRLTRRPFSQAELIADGLLHAVALLASIIGLTVLIVLVLFRRGNLELSAVVIYGVGLLAMFGFSAAYNLVPISPLKWVLRRFDHSSIYLMIAGTYTPFLVLIGDPFWSIIMGIIVWGGAISGIVLKVALPGQFDRLSIAIYILLGGSALIAIRPMVEKLPAPTLYLLLAGGIIYVAGVAFYVWKNLRFNNVIWHGFVSVAAGCHYAAIAYAMTA